MQIKLGATRESSLSSSWYARPFCSERPQAPNSGRMIAFCRKKSSIVGLAMASSISNESSASTVCGRANHRKKKKDHHCPAKSFRQLFIGKITLRRIWRSSYFVVKSVNWRLNLLYTNKQSKAALLSLSVLLNTKEHCDQESEQRQPIRLTRMHLHPPPPPPLPPRPLSHERVTLSHATLHCPKLTIPPTTPSLCHHWAEARLSADHFSLK